MSDLSPIVKRICPDCPGLLFFDITTHSDHLQTHNPSPQQWHDAYTRILRGKERQKKAEREE